MINNKGKTKELSKKEGSILLEGLKENSEFLLGKLISSYSISSLLLVAKGELRKMRRVGPILTPNERMKLFQDVFDFDLETIEFITSEDLSIKIHAGLNTVPMINEIVANNQYGLTPENIKGKTVVDVGANTGIFSILAGKMGAKKVYAFEPISGNLDYLKKNIQLNNLEEIVVPINKACGDEEEIKNISCSGFPDDTGASFVRRTFPCSQTVDVVRIDDFIDEKVDFIKVDTEGYERQVILGAGKTIKENEPVMAFSLYHFEEDKEELPRIVKKINPRYSCESMERGELVAYCHVANN